MIQWPYFTPPRPTERSRINALLRDLGSIGLRAKIAVMVAGIVLILGLSASVVVRKNLADTLESRLRRHAQSVALAVAAHQLDSEAAGTPSPVDHLVEAMVMTDPEVLFAVIHDGTGSVLVQAARSAAPSDRLSPPAGSSPIQEGITTVATSAGTVLEATVPVGAGPRWARVGVTTAVMDGELAATTRALALLTLLALPIATTLSVALTHVLTRPIVALQRAVRGTSMGNLPQAGGPVLDDEIGQLTRAFYAMTAGLERSRDALLARNRELAVLNATAQAVGGSLEPEHVLRASLEAILREMDLKAGWIFLCDGEPETGQQGGLRFRNGRPTLAIAVGLSRRFELEEAQLDWRGCHCLHVLNTGDTYTVADLRTDCPRLRPETIQSEGLITHTSVPLVARDRVLGVLNVAADTPRAFREDELRMLRTIGRQIGVAVDNSRLWNQVQRKERLRGRLLERTLHVQEAERRRIALELHDQFGSSLASLAVSLRVLENDLASPRDARRRLGDLRALVSGIARDLHQLAFDLRPAALDRLGLADAVEETIKKFAPRHGLAADFQAIGLEGLRLSPEVETAVYRVVQEALTNVAKHARATEVAVLLERRADTIVAIVEDNGRGFDLPAALATDGGRLGLFGMQERAAHVGGAWSVETAPGMGAAVFLEVPLRAAMPADLPV